MNLSDFKTTFDAVLQTYVDEKINQSKNLLADPKLNTFVQYVQTFIFSGGKRVRPYSLRAIYTGLGGVQEADVLKLGIIFELLHSMALIHDDIIDQAGKRHNELTMHEYIKTLLPQTSNTHHIAEGQAILMGDLLLSWVYELRYKVSGFDPNLLDHARVNIHEMIEEVILGQMIDVDMMISGPASLDMIDKKNMYKTASYTFVRPMLTGAILAGASEDVQKNITEFGQYLGLAFQVRDDLLDLTGGDPTKSLFSDMQEGQQTYFTNYMFTKGTPEQQALLKECLGRRLSDEEIAKLQTMFIDSGAIDYGKVMVQDFVAKARNSFAKIPFVHDDAKSGLEQLIEKIEKN